MQRITAELLQRMLLQGAASLEHNRAAVDALNVFPVPDGDTGTNMNLTLQAVVKAIVGLNQPSIGQVATACSTGSLMGARGNSGVILSQLFRGFGKHLADKGQEISASDFVAALQAGVDTVYKAVRKPVEGTILTVMRESAKAAEGVARRTHDPLAVMQTLVSQSERTLARTPEMLPVLKQQGVVDAGGQGLVFIYQGFLAAVQGKEISQVAPPPIIAPVESLPAELGSLEEIEFGYCTEFMIRQPAINEDSLHDQLEKLGDSLLVVGDDTLLKVHVHTNDPGLALQIGLKYGQLTGIKVENMREQHSSLYSSGPTETLQPPKPLGVVAVVAGEGLQAIYRSMGVDAIVSGGQTMNPSTEDLAKAVESVRAEQVLILPNNKNVVMAAEQVQDLIVGRVRVIPSVTLPQGLAALMSYNPESENVEAMVAAMERNLRQVKSGQVTTAVRDHSCPAGEVKEGDYIGILESEIVCFGPSLPAVTADLIARMVDDDDGLISIFSGQVVSEAELNTLASDLSKLHPDMEIECHVGGQPVYHYLISVE
jgi:DAK2 domain fusion protein YloV